MAYTQPTAAELKMRFTAFAAVPDQTVEYWLEDARLTVTESWIEADRAPGEMELAAHNMARQGLGSGGVGTGDMAGVTDFKSASFSVSFDTSAVKAAAAGGYASSPYGQDFAVRLRRNVGGPFLAGAPALPGCCF
jgi:hypothetical protein